MFDDNPRDSHPDDYRTLYNKAIELLARREHSRAELSRKLASHRVFETENTGQNQRLISCVLDELARSGYQSDERFAEAYVRSRLRKGFGLQRIALELGQRGVDEPIATKALGAYANGDDDLNTDEVIYNTWQKKFGLPPQDLKERSKQQRFLYYRGFSGDDIARLFDRIDQVFRV
ncbi:MAG TPA: regulatory protein RecX [Marinagarivorans sp.]